MSCVLVLVSLFCVQCHWHAGDGWYFLQDGERFHKCWNEASFWQSLDWYSPIGSQLGSTGRLSECTAERSRCCLKTSQTWTNNPSLNSAGWSDQQAAAAAGGETEMHREKQFTERPTWLLLENFPNFEKLVRHRLGKRSLKTQKITWVSFSASLLSNHSSLGSMNKFGNVEGSLFWTLKHSHFETKTCMTVFRLAVVPLVRMVQLRFETLHPPLRRKTQKGVFSGDPITHKMKN